MSQGARNCPFLMFTGLPWRATFWMKFVWRQRKAGVCRTSTTAATSLERRVLVDVGQHRHADVALDPLEDAQPLLESRTRAGSRNEDRFALSNDDL